MNSGWCLCAGYFTPVGSPQKPPILGALIPPGLNAKAKKRPEPQMVEGGDELLNSH